MSKIDEMSVNAIRILSADAIQKANSGHPGLPLGCAPVAYELWTNHLNHNPADPDWENRDRFILSGGHGSMLLYSLLHLFGYGLTREDLMAFRQWDSKTPGHPEHGQTPGVEASTGPLGAGMAMAVGMAMAEKHMAAVFNKENFPVVDHYTYVLGGDGCMMEGISSEAFSLAGTLGLHKLIVIYDSNNITIEGSTDIAFRENVEKRMQAYGFGTISVEDGNDLKSLGMAIEAAKMDTARPTCIIVKTEIGYGCPAKQGKASAHGEPLGEENVKALRENLGWPYDEAFYVPQEIYQHFADVAADKAETEAAWQAMFAAYCDAYPEMEKAWEEWHNPNLAEKLMEDGQFWAGQEKPEATRSLSGKVINYLAGQLPNLFGGSADLAPSNKTEMKGCGDFSKETPEGRNIHFGIREMAMAAIGNGIMLHGGLQAFVSTFFVFSDFCKPMIRMSALMKLPLIYVFTHDSIGVGEDGPTHEPVEQLAGLRALPGIHVFRPCDGTETEAAWYSALTSRNNPTALVLSRQNLAPMAGSSKDALRGGYVIRETEGAPEVILMASGSEVQTAVAAADILADEGRKVRVVSMPCMELFDAQDESYRESVLPSAVRRRVAVEAGSAMSWWKYVGMDGRTVTIDRFGASAPGSVLFEKFGFTPENVAETARALF